MGLVHVALAKMRGVKVLLSEPDRSRREKALEMGADETIDPTAADLPAKVKELTDGRGAEAVFFTAGGVRALQEGVASLVKNGTLVVYGSAGSEKEWVLDPSLFHYDEIYVTGVTKHTKDSFRKAAELLSGYPGLFAGLISERYPFDRIEAAFERAESMETYRVVLEL
jgi:L-iditol 2-dehydrogenase